MPRCTSTPSGRFLKCLALAGLVATAGCAAHSVAVAPSPASPAPPAVVEKTVQLLYNNPADTVRQVRETNHISATADMRTGLLTLRGPAPDVAAAEQLIRQLENDATLLSDVFFSYPLQHAQAAGLAPLLLPSDQPGSPFAVLGSPNPTPYVVAYPRGNALLIMTEGKYERRVKEIMEKLDRASP